VHESMECTEGCACTHPHTKHIRVRAQELIDNEKKGGGKVPKESPEEMQDCEMVFADF